MKLVSMISRFLMGKWFAALWMAFVPVIAVACPFCAGNLASNGGAAAGFTRGIGYTIFLLLGMIASITGFLVLQIIKGEKRRAETMAANPEELGPEGNRA